MKFLIKVVFFSLFLISLFLYSPEPVKAEYSREYVIDDAIMLDKGTMSATDINNFLASKGSWLANYNIPEYISVPYPLSSGGLGYVDARQFNDVTGEPLYGKNVAQLIYDEAQSHNVNPRVIITILQKESSAIARSSPSSLTTQTWPLFYMYDESMESCLKFGTSCNDSAFRTRSIMYGGVGQQIAYATAWFRVRYNQYYGQSLNVTVDGIAFTCANTATRILYIYTPHIGSWQNFHTIFTSYFEDPTYGPPPPNQAYQMGGLAWIPPGSLEMPKTSNYFSGNFDGDNKSDATVMYNYGNQSISIITFSSAQAFSPKILQYLPAWSWDPNMCSKMVAGNFDNADSLDDIAVLYSYSDGSVGLWIFESSNTYRPRLRQMLPPKSWNMRATSALTAGNFDNAGGDDLGILYGYPNASIGVWSFDSSQNYTPRLMHVSGLQSMNFALSKGLASGDFDGDGESDLATIYQLGNNMLSIIHFNSSLNYVIKLAYVGAENGWNLSRASNIVSGDFDNADNLSDLAILYDYGLDTAGINNFNSVNNFQPSFRYWSGRKNFVHNKTIRDIASGDYNGDGRDDIFTLYFYESGVISPFGFFRTDID